MGSGNNRSQGPGNEPEEEPTTEDQISEGETPRSRTRQFEPGQNTPYPPRRQTRQFETDQRPRRNAPREVDTDYNPRRRQARPYETEQRATRRTRSSDDYDDEPPRRRAQRRRRQSAWPAILGGCAIGILLVVVAAVVVVFIALRSTQSGLPGIGNIPGVGGGSSQTFQHKDVQTVPMTTLSSLQVCDKIGTISIAVDPTAPSGQVQVKTTKIVHAANDAAANQEFSRITIEAQPPTGITNPLACTRTVPTPTSPGTSGSSTPATPTTGNSALVVNVTFPDSTGLVNTASDVVDMQITFPANLAAATSSATPLFLNVQDALGDINIDGLQGVLAVKGSSGNIKVTRAMLLSGSDIETGQGNVTFNGSLLLPTDTTASATYILQSEQGKLDVTLPLNTAVILDASSNVGSIQGSDFTINIKGNGGPATYRGALNSGASLKAVLTLDVSIGDITLHKAA